MYLIQAWISIIILHINPYVIYSPTIGREAVSSPAHNIYILYWSEYKVMIRTSHLNRDSLSSIRSENKILNTESDASEQ